MCVLLSRSWDEWVNDTRMFKFNEEGLKKQKEIEQQVYVCVGSYLYFFHACSKSGKKIKMLRKSDLLKQSYPPPEILRETERVLKPSETKQSAGKCARTHTE